MVDPANSSFTNTTGTESSVEIARLAGPHYGEVEYYPYLSALKDQNPSVYYRVYAEDGAIPTINSDYLYLGQILPTLDAPPPTVRSHKRCLSSVENIDFHVQTRLFIATSSESSMYGPGQMSILVHSGLGCTLNEPVALVCN